MKTALILLIMTQFISGENLSEPANLQNTESNTLNIFDLESTEHVVVAKGKGFFPVLNPTGDELFAIFRGGAGHLGKEGYLEIASSQEDGTLWFDPQYDEAGNIIEATPNIVINGPHDDRNPAVGITNSERIICAYLEQPNYDENGQYISSLQNAMCNIIYSDDSGETWSEPAPINTPELENCSPYGRIIQLEDGTLLMNVYGPYSQKIAYQNNVREDARFHTYIVRSRDNGVTWFDSVLIASAHNETAIFPVTTEHFIAISRGDHVGRLDFMHSYDGGYSWSNPLRLTNAGQHPADIIRLSNDWLLVFYGDRSQANKTIKGIVSKDNGRTWEIPNQSIFSRPVQGDFGYPSAVLMPNGKIAVMYYWAGNAANGYDGTQARLYLNLFDEKEWIDRYNSIF